jgi:hypothetical protein
MAEREQQNVTLFNNPRMTLLEVKMKLRVALRAVGRLFVSPGNNHSKSPSPSPHPEGRAPSNKLRKRNQHYRLIRRVTGGRSTDNVGDTIQLSVWTLSSMQQWNDTISTRRMEKAKQVDSEIDQNGHIGEGEISWKLQIGELERWAAELEMRMEEVNRHAEEVLKGTQEIMRATIELMKGTSKIRVGAMELLRRADELEEREVGMEKGMKNMMKGAEEIMKGAELMEKRADELKRNMNGTDSLQEGTSTMMRGDIRPVRMQEYKSPSSGASTPIGLRTYIR